MNREDLDERNSEWGDDKPKKRPRIKKSANEPEAQSDNRPLYRSDGQNTRPPRDNQDRDQSADRPSRPYRPDRPQYDRPQYNDRRGDYQRDQPERGRWRDSERDDNDQWGNSDNSELRNRTYQGSWGDRSDMIEREDRHRRGDYDRKPSWGDRSKRSDNRGRDDRGNQQGRGYGGQSRSGGDRQSYGERSGYGNRPGYGDRSRGGDDRQGYGDRSRGGDDRQGYGNRSRGGDRPGGGYNDRQGRNFRKGGFQGRKGPGRGKPGHIRPIYPESLNLEPVGPIRLNRYIASTGLCSRREADEYIKDGKIIVNGTTISELGTKVNPGDEVFFNGQKLSSEKKVYILLNKPKDYVTTVEDPNAKKTVMDLVKGACPERIYPVGRLDRMTTGVLLLTNDGELTRKLTHPENEMKKIYHLQLDKDLSAEHFQSIMEGITLEDGYIRADSLDFTLDNDFRHVGIEIHSGRNRIIRRIFEHFGYRVQKLDRVYFAGLTKKGLKRGEWRHLNIREVGFLKMVRQNVTEEQY